MAERPQTLGEEIANSISHGIGALLAVSALPLLIVAAVRHSDAAGITGAAIFGSTLLILYLASTLYHAFPISRVKNLFQLLDHIAIYLLIAGTYTPFTLGILKGVWGWTLFGIIWGLAGIGILFKSIFGLKYAWVSTLFYVLMGWVIVVAGQTLITRMQSVGIGWLIAGGLSYSFGVIFFVLSNRVKFSHFIWHLFVLGGSVCHFFAVLWYAW